MSPLFHRLRALALLAAVCFFAASSAAAKAPPKSKDAQCLTCHGDPAAGAGSDGANLYIDQKKMAASVHGSLLGCTDCHTDVKGPVHESPPKKIRCAVCHDAAQQDYLASVHVHDLRPGQVSANCQDCHGGAHQVLASSDPHSPVARPNIPATCGRCHAQRFPSEASSESAQAFAAYQMSVHGRADPKTGSTAAVCTDCHASHKILRGNDPASTISRYREPETCGQCHSVIARDFTASVHGQGLARGNQLSPSCTDCHGIHSIQKHTDPNSPVSAANLARTTCARCHQGVELTREYGVASGRVSSYQDSYHGLASKGGSSVVANCASCHGVHNILASTDPRSTIHKSNLAATCGQCHRGVSQRFVETSVHLNAAASRDLDSTAVRWVRWIYLILIAVVIGGMALHNAILWRSKALARRALENPIMQRMTLQQRWQHLALLSSFFVLVLTGFALKFPDSWLAQLLGMSEHLRSVVHRIAGVVLISAGLYHIVYVSVTREGRRLIRDIAPRPRDLGDLLRAMRFHLGLGGERPQFGRFGYAEKAEYWALVWGAALMGLTGVMLWAKVWVGNLLARWLVDVATAIHYYEAILATAAIFVWHFYQVFLDPDVAPMNWAWWDGKMPVEHYRHEHPLDTESLDQPPANPTDPPKQS
jgi:cytochrome b subunit of formate dehydrogenase/nitrate/TMAO reductase-like tetraheme cytochrome c subunit